MQIQPIIPNLTNKRKIAKKRIGYISRAYVILPCGCPVGTHVGARLRGFHGLGRDSGPQRHSWAQVPNFKPIRICFAILRLFIKFAIIGWI